MIKTTVQTFIILGCMAAGYVSIRTALETNQSASSKVMQALDNKLELYKLQSTHNFAAVLSHVDVGEEQTQKITEQVKGVADSLVGIAKSLVGIAQTAADLGEQNKKLLEGQNVVLEAHTKTIEENAKAAKEAVISAKVAAHKEQLQTRREIRAIAKPQKPWYQRWFSIQPDKK